MKTDKSNPKKQAVKRVAGDQESTEILSAQCNVRLQTDESIKSMLGIPGYLIIIKDNASGKEYKIHESMELEGFGDNSQVIFNGYTPKLMRLIACLKEIQRFRSDSNIEQQGLSERVSQ